MAHPTQAHTVQDPLYGRIAFDASLSLLISAPIAQRLRHVRLSNIDSVDLPSIANLSRYEHILGVAHLANNVGFRQSLNTLNRLALNAAALLHDWAITSFGHLVEEAFQYNGVHFHHEEHLSELSKGELTSDVLGHSRQILVGRAMGLEPWAMKVTSSPQDAAKLLDLIADNIGGRGEHGQVIAGSVDLDNIDNVTRVAYHLGLVRSGDLPLRLTAELQGVDSTAGTVIFSERAVADLEAWLTMRRAVYELLMLSERDFAGKLMLIAATVSAFEAGELTTSDWSLTDSGFIEKLLRFETTGRRGDAATRWYAGELWDMAPLSWYSGTRPEYPQLKEFSSALTEHMGRPYFAYAIKDKRNRCLEVGISGRGIVAFGSNSDKWLLGFGSPVRRAVTQREADRAWAFAETYFASNRLGLARAEPELGEELACLF